MPFNGPGAAPVTTTRTAGAAAARTAAAGARRARAPAVMVLCLLRTDGSQRAAAHRPGCWGRFLWESRAWVVVGVVWGALVEFWRLWRPATRLGASA